MKVLMYKRSLLFANNMLASAVGALELELE